MSSSVTSNLRARIVVRCDHQSFIRFCEIGRRWLDVSAAHQSNIVRDAQNIVQSSDSVEPFGEVYRSSFRVANKVDSLRLKTLALLWPTLTRHQQSDFVSQAELVAGE
jgi:hypothetical protein